MLPLVRFGLSRVSAVAIRRVAPLALPFGALATHSLLQQPVAVCEKVVVESIEINGEKLDTKEITMTTTKGTTVVIATFSRRIWASIFDALYGIMKMFGGAVIGGVAGFGMAVVHTGAGALGGRRCSTRTQYQRGIPDPIQPQYRREGIPKIPIAHTWESPPSPPYHSQRRHR